MITPSLNKGTAFTAEERKQLNLTGLLPPVITDLKLDTERALAQLHKKTSDLEKYIFLQTLQDTNEDLYYNLLMNYTHELMPLVYTPTVGEACIEFSRIYRQTPRGLYITINDLGHVREILDNWPVEDIKAICFTDGERILGLGDLGCNGMGIPNGKLSLYTACAGVHPKHCLPITIDVGTNNEENLNDPFYIGLRHKRVTGEKYDALIDEFMNAAKEKYGPEVLLQFEDFGNHNAFRFLKKYQKTHCSFNDDIQGTAAVALGGLLAATPLTGKPLSDHKFLFLGAGEAGTGIAELIALAISRETQKPLEEARKQISLVDSKGLIVASRKDKLQEHKVPFAHENEHCGTLLEAIEKLQPTALIGVCTIPKTFNKDVCAAMCKYNERPIICALSNPTSKAECTAEEAYTFTDGKCIFSSGSPFHPVEYKGKKYVPGQGNNSYIFPGIGLACSAVGLTCVDDDIMLIAAETLASCVTKEDLETVTVYPPLSSIQDVSLDIAVAVAEYGYKMGYASLPKPADLRAHIKASMYKPGSA